METRVSVAQFKSRLSHYIAETRRTQKRLIVTSRDRPVAMLTPLNDLGLETASAGGLASVAGEWAELGEISSWIDEAAQNRGADGYREISL